ncbi:hypothetical protein [Desulfovibrio ferrophilus]|uniref:OmpA family protein n=1 Tax=Desulfovibrio ferrophilus TaxID=241368 RepID=A0A2Z6AVC1_9BACT|nr:hypothetical protein [Desulfovibrio ferrophilus]BBD07181.1 OmpA family protein [Desulfovibrio ferrophilus]
MLRSLWLVLWLLLPLCAMAAEPIPQGRVRRVAVMPLGMFSNQGHLIDAADYVGAGLAGRGFDVVPQDRLEQFRVDHRLRRAEFMDRSVLRVLGVELGVDALVVGQAYMTGEDIPRATVSAQLVECGDSSVVWAESVSASGDDYTTVLGLGRINDMETLLQRVVGDLLSSMPEEMLVHPSTVPDFEIARAGFKPEILRGGQRATLVVEIKPGGEPLRRIRAYLLDREIELHAQGNGHFSGELIAPMVERSYPLRIYVTDAWNKLVTVETDAVLTVDNSPPPLSFHSSDRVLSPNADGVQDQIRFTPEVGDSLHIRGWSVCVTDASGHAVRSEEGRGELPEFFVWGGQDDAGHIMPDGEYVCSLTVTDRAGNSTVASVQRLEVDTAPPRVAVSLVEVDERRMVTMTPAPLDKVSRWSLTLHRDDRSVIIEYYGRGTPPPTVQVPDRAAAYSLETWDQVGNRQWVDVSPLLPPEPEFQEMDLEPQERKVWVDDF